MADILSDLYLLSAVLKRYEDEGRIAEDRPVVDAIARDHLFAIEQSFAAVFANFPMSCCAGLMRVLVFPLGRHRQARRRPRDLPASCGRCCGPVRSATG